jgi:hypothetical protein
VSGGIVIKAMVNNGPIQLLFKRASSDSNGNGVTIEKVGNENAITIVPDTDKGVQLKDDHGENADYLIIRPSKNSPVYMEYNKHENTWSLVNKQ